MSSRLKRLAGSVAGALRLLRDDPERLARNVTQLTHPALFERRLTDVLNDAPMHVRIDPAEAGAGPPRLNVLDTAWSRTGMTGGPNTVVNLACRVAMQGVRVRLVSTIEPASLDPAWLRGHAASLLGRDDFPDIPVVSAGDPARPLALGPADLFLATHWSTARQLAPVLPALPVRTFFYMLQEFEPGFYAWSSNYALALETYGMDFHPVFNEALLADYMLALPFGRLADLETRRRATVFEPATDAALFRPGPDDAAPRAPRLLFYARPTNTRNLFGLGLAALREAAADPAFGGWEFLSIGGRGAVPDLPLGGGRLLRRAPWLDYAGYADLLRGSDVLLCPMLSPHTSYPVLEMAACGGLSVTNTFATKTAAALSALSDNIVAVEPTVAGFAAGLVRAARTVGSGAARAPSLRMPRDWAAALDPVAARIAAVMRELAGG